MTVPQFGGWAFGEQVAVRHPRMRLWQQQHSTIVVRLDRQMGVRK
jgi:hypothetical protein